MTTSFHDWTIERDNTLVKGLCAAARSNRNEMREWIEAEIKALLEEAQIKEPVSCGVIADHIRKSVETLRHTSTVMFPEALRDYDGVIENVSIGGFDSVEEAHDQLQSGFMHLVRILRELHEMRGFIGDM